MSEELVTLTIDGKEVRVPKGMNLIEAAKSIGIEIPHYCYHPHLSIAGNCRMCQIEIEGRPKLEIACNTGAQEGMVVKTHFSSERTADAQRATLEFLLINHPLDCTVCDQAGHCKLQDYYYEYNSQPSRFIEEKVHKVKAEPFGPEIIYDGERCILCTRCVRFCDEVTGTGELGVFNRGDKAVIGIHEGKQLDNPLSGCVVDLCPVGALTHRRWRFNTRIWYTKEVNTVCTGCSTGCNAKVAVRDDQIVHVKGRLNSEVNQEWMCDEGRYGFHRFQPLTRLQTQYIREGDYLKEAPLEEALTAAAKLGSGAPETKGIFLSPFLTLEEIWAALAFGEKVMNVGANTPQVAMQVKQRPLTPVESVLVSPDYAPNARAMNLFGHGLEGSDWRAQLQAGYEELLGRLRRGELTHLLIVGDYALPEEDLDEETAAALLNVEVSVALTPRGLLRGEGEEERESLGAHQLCSVILPSRTVNEKSGIMVNHQLRFQRLQPLLAPLFGTYSEWMLLGRAAKSAGKSIMPEIIIDDRAMFRHMVKQYEPLRGLTLAAIGEDGLTWEELGRLQQKQAAEAAEAP